MPVNCCLPYTLPFQTGPYEGDKRIQIKFVLDQDLALTKDDDVTAARVLVTFPFPEELLKNHFKKYDIIITISRVEESDEAHGNVVLIKGAYQAEIWAIDKKSIVGWKLRKKAVDQIREIMNRWTGSYHAHRTAIDADIVLGGSKIYHTTQRLEHWSYQNV